MEFMGYVRPDGKVGARNYVAVIPSVTCANDVANAICHQVQGTITYLHHQGCCQMPPDLERVTDTLISLGMSPNVGAILIVSLGCEGTDHERMYKELSATGKHVEIIHIQELGGVSKAIQLGTDIARKLVIEIPRPAAPAGGCFQDRYGHQVRCFRYHQRHGFQLCYRLCSRQAGRSGRYRYLWRNDRVPGR